MNRSSLPKFSSLPLRKGDPIYSAWGLYGDDDEIGTLNRLTNQVVVDAAKEISTGTRISLDCPLDVQIHPFFGRQPFSKNVFNKAPRCVNDDTWTFNTQSSSQWDGLRHFAYQKERRFYNGKTLDDIIGDPKSTTLGIQSFAKRGIIGRGVLLDFESWRLKNDISVDHFKSQPIRLDHLKAVAESQGTEIKFGDILLIRSGYCKAFQEKSKENQSELESLSKVSPPNFVGVEQSEQVLEWVWNNFSAVAGDQPAFEQFPTQREFAMHEILLSGWGLPIGELMDLEELSEHCKKLGRWSFFLSSKPCNVPGGVASPPNMMAIF